MAAKFEVFKDVSDYWRFRLVAKNGRIIASSEGYTTKRSCLEGIESIQRNADAQIVMVDEKIE